MLPSLNVVKPLLLAAVTQTCGRVFQQKPILAKPIISCGRKNGKAGEKL